MFTSRAAAFGDVDGDGGVDILVANCDGPAHLLRNVASPRGSWISFRVVLENGRDAIGAAVSLRAGERRLFRDVRAAYSYLASSDPKVHFGLGDRRRGFPTWPCAGRTEAASVSGISPQGRWWNSGAEPGRNDAGLHPPPGLPLLG